MSSTKGMFNLEDSSVPSQSSVSNKSVSKKKPLARATSRSPARARMMKDGTVIIPKKEAPVTATSSRYSKEEIQKMLAGYVVLPRMAWEQIKPGSHMRYVRAFDNRFVRGGFLAGYIQQKGKTLITLTSGFGGQRKTAWTLALSSIKTIYVKK